MQQLVWSCAVKASIGKVCNADYYTHEVAEDRHDYYAGHGEATRRWTGAHAAKLGLNGEVDAAAFAEVLANHHPVTGEKLKPHDNLVNLAFDVTFSPVKSVSVLWALDDEQTRAQVVDPCEAGHAAALAYLEQQACVARLGRQGADARPGQGFAAAVFRHRFSRERNPQLHWHTVLANVAEADDGRRAALDGTLLYAHAPTAAAIAERVSRTQLAQQGVVFERRDDRWEIAGVPPALCREFSKRRTQIEEALADRAADPDDGHAAQQAALATRIAKSTATSNVHNRWYAEALAAGHEPTELTPYARTAVARPPPTRTQLIRRVGRSKRWWRSCWGRRG